MPRKDDGLRRGFKTLAERLALEIRTELGLSLYDPLDPRTLADHLGIPVVSLSELAPFVASSDSIEQFLEHEPDAFSAMTVYEGAYRLIVENPSHSSRRRVNSLTHELAHVLLEHEPGPVFGIGGCRSWSSSDEAEADWLAGVLLVPRSAALRIARDNEPVWHAAQRHGVSVKLMEWRLNHSGARKQADSERKGRRPSPRRFVGRPGGVP